MAEKSRGSAKDKMGGEEKVIRSSSFATATEDRSLQEVGEGREEFKISDFRKSTLSQKDFSDVADGEER